MTISLEELAKLVEGRIVGDAGLTVRGAARLDHASPDEISFVDSDARARDLAKSNAAAVVTAEGIDCGQTPSIVVSDVLTAFAQIVLHFRPQPKRARTGVSEHALLGKNVMIGADVEIHPGASIGDNTTLADGVTIHSGVRIRHGCHIGAGSRLFPNVVVYENTKIGERCLVHANAVLGAYGFGYTQENGKHVLSEQLGYVEIGNDVEIGASTTIDRGTYGATIIGDGTKLDNLVMIAHNCHIGKHNLICSQVGVAGSSTTGDYVVMAGQVGVRDHVHVGHQAVIGSKAGVSHDVPEGRVMLGAPAVEARQKKMQMAALAKLPEMRKEFRKLQKSVAELTEKSNSAQSEPQKQGGGEQAA